MLAAVAAFELRYQLTNPVFWIANALFALLVFGIVTVVEPPFNGSPLAIVVTHGMLSLFYLFVAAAFVANAVVRDDETGFGLIVHSTRLPRPHYLLGRFAGAFLASAIGYLAVPLAILAGMASPWFDPEPKGTSDLGDLAYAYCAIGLPNLFLICAVLFTIATLTRSMIYSYVGGLALLVAYFVVNGLVGRNPFLAQWAPVLEPFGLTAVSRLVRYWGTTELRTALPPFSGTLLGNRALWSGVAALALFISCRAYRAIPLGAPSRWRGKKESLDAAEPCIAQRPVVPAPSAAAFTRLWACSRFEMAAVLKSPAFLVLLFFASLNAIVPLFSANEVYGTPTLPLTFVLIELLASTAAILPIIIALFYSGELVWRDRDRRMHEIVDATALPNWAYVAPKILALTGLLAVVSASSALMAMLVQLARGYTHLEPEKYLGWYLLPQTLDMLLLAVLAVVVQALSPNKYVGWGIMVIYLVATIKLASLGFDHPLYLYPNTGNVLLSDMNADHVGGATSWWLRLYWGAVALALAVLAHVGWRRGTAFSSRPGLAQMRRRLQGVPGKVLAASLGLAVLVGAFLYYHMNVLNDYVRHDEQVVQAAEYEKRYLQYEKLPQPALTHVQLNVQLFPHETRMEANGQYRFVNDTGATLRELHVRLLDDLELLAMKVPGATLTLNDEPMGYRIYRFATPLPRGATGELEFKTRRWQKGMQAGGDDAQLVRNGTFLNSMNFMPAIGMSRAVGLLSDKKKRREHGLPEELRPAKLEDTAAQSHNAFDADWVFTDITVTTDAAQTPMAPGSRVSDESRNGRRTARFVSRTPILSFLSIQSAGYARKTSQADGVELSVYYDRAHPFNVERMLRAMQLSLGYFSGAFGPYQFDHVRIVEFPGYATFAQSFAGTVPYSEKIGFIADAGKPGVIDYVTYVTAHELAHQYWGHQLVAADMQGAGMLSETLAQYSALMVMKRLYGEDQIRRFLKYELDTYLAARGRGASSGEPPLARVEGQVYIHYQKGGLALYLLQDRLGEERVNGVLAALLDRYRFRGPPYPRSLELVAGLKSLARDPLERQLASDLLEKVTLYDLEAQQATVRKLADGRFETRLTVNAEKYYADAEGSESKAPLRDLIDVGAFSQRPGLAAFDSADVLLMERRPITSGKQRLRIVTRRRPAFVGIDPYNKYIDRRSGDNVVAVEGG